MHSYYLSVHLRLPPMSFYSLSSRQTVMYKYDLRAIRTPRRYVTLSRCSRMLKFGRGLERTVEENVINIDGNKAHRVHWSSVCACVCVRVYWEVKIKVVHTQRDVKIDLDPDVACNL